MTIANAIKKLEKAGWTVSYHQFSNLYLASKDGIRNVIDFHPNGSNTPENSIVCLRVRGIQDRDDMQSDYCAGSFCDSMTQALRWAARL